MRGFNFGAAPSIDKLQPRERTAIAIGISHRCSKRSIPKGPQDRHFDNRALEGHLRVGKPQRTNNIRFIARRSNLSCKSSTQYEIKLALWNVPDGSTERAFVD